METINVVQTFKNVICVDMFTGRKKKWFLGPKIQRTISSEMIVFKRNP